MLGSEAAERARVGGQEEDRVVGRRRLRGRATRNERASSISAAVPEPLSFAPGLAPRVVPVREDDDDLVRAALTDGLHVFQLNAAPAGDFRVKTVDFRVQAETAQLALRPGRCVAGPLGAWNANRELVREALGGERRGSAVELGLEGRRTEDCGPIDREGGEEEGDADEEPGSPVHPAVDRTCERSRSRSPLVPRGRESSHARL